MSQTESSYPVSFMLKKETSAPIIDYFLDLDQEEYVRKQQIIDDTGVSRETLSNQIGSTQQDGILYHCGIVDRSSDDSYMPRYKRGETTVMEFFENYEGYPLSKLFATKIKQALTEFFVFSADPDREYSTYRLSEILGSNYQSIPPNIEVLVDAGIVTRGEDDNGTTVYTLNTDSEVAAAIAELNDRILDVYMERTD